MQKIVHSYGIMYEKRIKIRVNCEKTVLEKDPNASQGEKMQFPVC